MDKEITYGEFAKSVSEWWGTPDYTYGCIAFAAVRARDEFKKNGITNADEHYEEFKKKRGDSFYYAGD